MLKKLIVAGTLSLGLLGAEALSPALADTDIDIGIGFGGGYGQPEAGPRYWPAGGSISCRQGARIVANAGYRRVRPLDCNGSQYSYQGYRRDNLFRITVRAKNGNIRKVERVRRGGGGWGGGGWGGGYGDGYDDGYGDDYGDDYY